MKNIAIIPARSGSKGLKDKNIKLLNGRPLIAYTISAALESEAFEEVFVSTDSFGYAQIAMEFGADVPFLREPELASDTATTWDVVRDVLFRYMDMGKSFDTCAVLQPTSPLRDYSDIIRAYDLYRQKQADAVISVCETDHPAQWCFPLDSDLSMEEFSKSTWRDKRRQDIPASYRENGAIYIASTSLIMKPDYDIYIDKCFAYIMDKDKSIDIDSQLDFDIADNLVQKTRGNSERQ